MKLKTPGNQSELLISRAIDVAMSASSNQLTDVASWHAHVPFAHTLIDLLKPALVVELGVHKGDSLLSMATALENFGLDGRVVGIDTWQGDEHAGQYDGSKILADLSKRAKRFGKRVTLLQSTFSEALNGFAEGSIDLLHIDGLHTYDAVRSDFETWRPKMSPRGVVMLHDTVVKTGNFGVYKLWEEISGLGPSYNFDFGNGLGVLAIGHDVPKPLTEILHVLSTYPQIEGIFRAVGEALEGRTLRTVLAKRIEQLEKNIILEREKAGAELDRLNKLLSDQRDTARIEIERLNGEITSDRRAAGVEIERLNKAIVDERAVAKAELERLAEAANLSDRKTEQANLIVSTLRTDLDRLNGEIASDRQTAGLEIERLNQAIDDQRAAAKAELERLNQAFRDERDAAKGELERLEALHINTVRSLEQYSEESSALRAALTAERSLSQDLIDLQKSRLQEKGKALREVRAALTRNESTTLKLALEGESLRQRVNELEAALQASVANLEERQAAEAHIASILEGERRQAQNEYDRLNQEIQSLHRSYGAVIENLGLKRRAIRLFKKIAFPAFRLLPLPSKAKKRLRLAIVHKWGQHLQLVPPKFTATTSHAQLTLSQRSSRYLELSRAATGAPCDLPRASVSIVIPVYNQIEFTLRCIAAIHANTTELDYEIIVVDDCSSDMTKIMLSARDDITYIRNEKNLGFIGSCNAGLKHSGKTYVCYLNNDTEVTKHWLSALVDSFEMHPGVGMVGAQLIYPDGHLQEAGGIIWDDFSGWNWGRMQDPDNPKFNYARHADYCSGAAVVLPRKLANAIGGFDPEFAPAYGEDSDMSFRLRAIGLSTLYQPLSRVIHYEGVTSGTDTSTGVKAYQVVNAAKLKERWKHVLTHQGENGKDPKKAVERGRLGRLLVIDQITPEPDKDAGSITALELMLAFRDLGYKVDFIPCSNFANIPDYTDLLGGLGIESILYPWAKSVKDHLEQVGDIYDAVILFRVNTAQEHMKTVRSLAKRAKIIFHSSDLHFLREQRAQSVSNPNIAEHLQTPENTRKSELAIIGNSDVTIVHSQYEAELLAEALPKTQVVVFPWIYEPRVPTRGFRDRKDIIFLGGYRHYPNVDAVLHYANDIAPILEGLVPDFKFRAIGSEPNSDMLALASERLVIDGFVSDLDGVLSTARLMLVPLRYGAGIKGKIITALAHGLPVVTTSVGAEGMGLINGEHVLIADTPEDIAQAAKRLHNDQELWERLQKNGLAFVGALTSRKAGFEKTRLILEKCGLPALHTGQNIPARSAFSFPGGTPSPVYDAATLADAICALQSGHVTDENVVLVTPDGAVPDSIIANDPGKVRVSTLKDLHDLPTGPWALVVDAFDDQFVDDAVTKFRSRFPGICPPSILFLPPRLQILEHRYEMRHVLSGRAVQESQARVPVHIRHAKRLADAFGDQISWHADCSILGYPSITAAVF